MKIFYKIWKGHGSFCYRVMLARTFSARFENAAMPVALFGIPAFTCKRKNRKNILAVAFVRFFRAWMKAERAIMYSAKKRKARTEDFGMAWHGIDCKSAFPATQ